MKLKKCLLAAAAASAFWGGVAGCSDEPVNGTVADKEYKPAKTQTSKVPVYKDVCSYSRGKRTCRKVQSGTATKTWTQTPECFELELTSGWEGCVSREAWENLGVGDVYDSSAY